ncbi:hypothetical protein KIPB_003109 [Kipferlia bialata]|uniref:Uncharacterized protein n=1 Tax=Kipferlia bialata TaxID=797122 RepID=A0A9K3CSF6_9EUKA|nr:hypothetical protein KIPB_003109 [Kipferlia bialata]|eukprot:g3109.t1
MEERVYTDIRPFDVCSGHGHCLFNGSLRLQLRPQTEQLMARSTSRTQEVRDGGSHPSKSVFGCVSLTNVSAGSVSRNTRSRRRGGRRPRSQRVERDPLGSVQWRRGCMALHSIGGGKVLAVHRAHCSILTLMSNCTLTEEVIPPMPQGNSIYGYSVTPMCGRVYVFGGRPSYKECLPTLSWLQLDTLTWHTLQPETDKDGAECGGSPTLCPCGRTRHVAYEADGCLVVSGGVSGRSSFDEEPVSDSWSYDPESNLWMLLPLGNREPVKWATSVTGGIRIAMGVMTPLDGYRDTVGGPVWQGPERDRDCTPVAGTGRLMCVGGATNHHKWKEGSQDIPRHWDYGPVGVERYIIRVSSNYDGPEGYGVDTIEAYDTISGSTQLLACLDSEHDCSAMYTTISEGTLLLKLDCGLYLVHLDTLMWPHASHDLGFRWAVCGQGVPRVWGERELWFQAQMTEG